MNKVDELFGVFYTWILLFLQIPLAYILSLDGMWFALWYILKEITYETIYC